MHTETPPSTPIDRQTIATSTPHQALTGDIRKSCLAARKVANRKNDLFFPQAKMQFSRLFKHEKFDKIQEKKAALELKDLQEKRKIGQVTEIIKEELGNNKTDGLL